MSNNINIMSKIIYCNKMKKHRVEKTISLLSLQFLVWPCVVLLTVFDIPLHNAFFDSRLWDKFSWCVPITCPHAFSLSVSFSLVSFFLPLSFITLWLALSPAPLSSNASQLSYWPGQFLLALWVGWTKSNWLTRYTCSLKIQLSLQMVCKDLI